MQYTVIMFIPTGKLDSQNMDILYMYQTVCPLFPNPYVLYSPYTHQAHKASK